MNESVIKWLRISYWAGAILDLTSCFVMLFPPLFVFMNQPNGFEADASYRYAMGMGVPLMFAWTILLLWADRKPVERKDVLPITLVVVVGEIAIQVWGIATGFVPLFALLPTFAMQVILIFLFSFSYLKARRVS